LQGMLFHDNRPKVVAARHALPPCQHSDATALAAAASLTKFEVEETLKGMLHADNPSKVVAARLVLPPSQHFDVTALAAAASLTKVEVEKVLKGKSWTRKKEKSSIQKKSSAMAAAKKRMSNKDKKNFVKIAQRANEILDGDPDGLRVTPQECEAHWKQFTTGFDTKVRQEETPSSASPVAAVMPQMSVAMQLPQVSHAMTQQAALVFAQQAALLSHISTLSMPLLPPGWQMARDPASGKFYFYSTTTGVVQWEPPGLHARVQRQ